MIKKTKTIISKSGHTVMFQYENPYQKKISEEIISKSNGAEFNSILSKWHNTEYKFTKNSGNKCACGKNPIHHVYTFTNGENGEKIKIGSECIERNFPNKMYLDHVALDKLLKFKNWTKHKHFVDYLVNLGIYGVAELEYSNKWNTFFILESDRIIKELVKMNIIELTTK